MLSISPVQLGASLMKLNITNNTLKHRFETEIGAQTAFLNYRLVSGIITLTHTEVPSSLNGRGIGTALAKAALDYAVENHLRVVPRCPFVADYVQAHPQYQSILASTPNAASENK
jgi:predicted GNAT family acetyltransferase